MFARRTALFTAENEATKLARGEVHDILEMKNDFRRPINEIVKEIYEILDWIGYSQDPELAANTTGMETASQFMTDTDSDSILDSL